MWHLCNPSQWSAWHVEPMGWEGHGETHQEMRMCVRDWRKTSTDSRNDGFYNIQYIQILLVSFPDNFFFPQQVVLHLSLYQLVHPRQAPAMMPF